MAGTRKALYRVKGMRRLSITGGLRYTDLMESPDLFKKIFPEIAPELDIVLTNIKEARCSDCVARRKLVPIVNRVSRLAKDRDISELADILGDDKLAALAGVSKVEPPSDEGIPDMSGSYMESESSMDPLDDISEKHASYGIRPSCMDCVNKHIAQAIILLQESRLGYPKHRWLAVGHLAEASEEALGTNPILAAEIRSARLMVMAGGDPPLEDLLPED